jgi:hypothetical protein
VTVLTALTDSIGRILWPHLSQCQTATIMASRTIRIDALKSEITLLRARDAELTERIARDGRERDEVREALCEADAEVEVEVNTPVANGVDPTEWLPEELRMAILIQVVTAGVCGLVCRRWHAVCQTGVIKRRAWDGRWEGYTEGWRVPRQIPGLHTVFALAVGLEGAVYSGGKDITVRVWSGGDGTLLRTLEGHTDSVASLAVGADGTVYSGSKGPIHMWSDSDGAGLGTLEGHPGHFVYALAVASDGTVFSGSDDETIRVWSDGERVRTLTGHTGYVTSLAIGIQSKLYSASFDETVRVWSTIDGTPIAVLEGHTCIVYTVAVRFDGSVYSGSSDGTISVWSGEDESLLRTLFPGTVILSIAFGSDGTVFSGSQDRAVLVWCGMTGTLRNVLPAAASSIRALALGQDNKLYAGLDDEGNIEVW